MAALRNKHVGNKGQHRSGAAVYIEKKRKRVSWTPDVSITLENGSYGTYTNGRRDIRVMDGAASAHVRGIAHRSAGR